MRTRNNKLINFILEFSQIMLVFLGVYSALMCSATSLELIYDNTLVIVMMFAASIIFYGLFTVLETFRKGKLYGIIGITLFFAVIAFRFMGALQKGFVNIANSFLKEFMNYTGTNLTLLSYTDIDGASIKFCTNLLLILLGVYLTAIISAFFYRRRRSVVFLAGTIPFVVLPLVVGRVGYYSNFFTYLVVAITIVGTRHLRTDATDRRMRQKLAIILMLTCLVCGGIFYAFIPPQRYENNVEKLTQAKNSLVALTSWEGEDVLTWLKAYFNGDAISYGKIGKKSEVTYTGETMLKLSGDVNSNYGLYLKGYVGDVYENNRWSSRKSDEDFKKDWKTLDDIGVTLENWHTQLRNELGDQETSGEDDIWKTGVLRVRNIAFGYGNYLVPCLPTGAYKSLENGRSTIDEPGIDYAVEYYLKYPAILRSDMLKGNYRMANGIFWGNNEAERELLKEFAEKYYLQVPESLNGVCVEFEQYLKEQNNLLERFQKGTASKSDIIQAVKTYITRDTSYSLSPGKTPSDRDSVEYFLKESKKGYCIYYATTAAMLLRSVGIPTRYVEGMYVSKEELKDCAPNEEIKVPDEDAHAWIEVFDEKYGFVTVEVTPGRGEEDMQNSDSTNEKDKDDNNQTTEPSQENPVSEPEEQPQTVTPTPAVTQEPEESMVFDDIEGNEEASEDAGNDEKTQNSGILSTILKIGILVILIVAAIEIQRRIRKHLFQKNMRTKKAKRRIRMVYLHLLPVWMRYSIAYRGQSMGELTREIVSAMELPEEDIAVFVELLFHARFGPDTISEEQLQEFDRIYQEIRKKAYDDAKLIRKLYYMYIMVL